MEIKINQSLGKPAVSSLADSKQQEKPKTGGLGAAEKSRADRLTLSRQGVAHLQTLLDTGRSKRQEEKSQVELLLEQAQQQAEAVMKEAKIRLNCQKIASSMMQGDRVPPEDEKYLMKHDPELYRLVMASRMLKREDPEDKESVLDEEDRKAEAESDRAAAAPAPVSAPAPAAPAAGGGGESSGGE